jgi:UDP-N-acetylmuramyl pentapeptide phosphotransferase/UDP-N-acetylglucosamine-1-phosphate transferase
MLVETLLIPVFSFVLNYMLIAKIRGISFALKLFDKPNDRSSHSRITPNLAGISFFIVFLIGFSFISKYDANGFLLKLLPGMVILFFIGLKDDLLLLSAATKFIAQLLSILFLLWPLNTVELNLHGFLGIYDLGNTGSVIFWIFALVGIINAVNLIDGINGLLGTLSIITFSTFCILFYLLENYLLFLLSLMAVFSLIAFLTYNLSDKKRIFMGDTGSLLLGFLIASILYSLFQFNELQIPIGYSNLPYFAVSIIFIPLFDTLRVFIIRMLNKKSPFSPDRNHIHHIIIDYFRTTHVTTTIVICSIQLFILFATLFLSANCNQQIISVFLFLIVTLLVLVLYKMRKTNLKKN